MIMTVLTRALASRAIPAQFVDEITEHIPRVASHHKLCRDRSGVKVSDPRSSRKSPTRRNSPVMLAENSYAIDA